MSLRRGKRTRILARICIPFACAAAVAAILLSVMSRHQIRTVAPDTGFSTLEVVQCLGSLIQEEFADMESLSAKPVGGNVILTVNFTDGSSQCYIMTKDGDDGISLLAPRRDQEQEIEKQQLQTLKNTTDMKMTLFSSLLAAFLLLSAFPAHGQNDTVDRYYIDKELVSDFDGSQLIGKQISDYRIEYRKGDRPGLTERCNFILTARHALPEKARPLLATAEKDTAEIVTWVFADGYVIEKEKVSGFFEKIAPNDIESVKVYKFGPNGYSFFKNQTSESRLGKTA